MKMGEIIERMERLSACWKAQFDNPPELPLHWTIDAGGVLRLDGHAVCNAADVAAGESYDVELLQLQMCDGRQAKVKIVWPYSAPARIAVMSV